MEREREFRGNNNIHIIGVTYNRARDGLAKCQVSNTLAATAGAAAKKEKWGRRGQRLADMGRIRCQSND